MPAKPFKAATICLRSIGLIVALLFANGAAGAQDVQAHVRELIDRRVLAEAETIAVHQLASDIRNPEWVLLLAEIRLDQHRFGESLELLRNAQELGDNSERNRLLAGLDYVALKRNDLAEPQLRAAAKLNPKDPSALYYLGRLLYTKNSFDEAIAVTRRALALEPTMIRAYDNLGLCYEAKQMFGEAEKEYSAGIAEQRRSQAKTEWPALDLGTMLFKQQKIERAKAYVEEALAINPNSAEAHLRLATILERQGELQSAEEELRCAIGLDPKLASAHYRLAMIFRKLGQSNKADAELQSFQRLSSLKSNR